MKIIKAILFIFASAVMVASLIFVPEAAAAVSISYVAVLGLYLGLDVAEMIVSTSKLKAGQFQELSVHKFIIAGICLAACIIVCGAKWEPVLQPAMTTLLSAVMVILACAIGGLEGNKIATQHEGTE